VKKHLVKGDPRQDGDARDLILGSAVLIAESSQCAISYELPLDALTPDIDRTDMSPLKRFMLYWLPVLVYCLAIFIQSSYPASEHLSGFDLSDKLMHAGAFTLLGFLFYRAIHATGNGISTTGLVLSSICFTILYGASDEIHQYFVPERTAEFLDFAADAIGGIVGVMAAMVISWSRQPMRS
jgi:VanZ family protein